jgi:hypothetical protein
MLPRSPPATIEGRIARSSPLLDSLRSCAAQLPRRRNTYFLVLRSFTTWCSRYSNALARVADLPLRGAGVEPVDFARTIVSHGVAELPPNRVELEARTLETTLPVPRAARTIRITASGAKLGIDAVAGEVGTQARDALTKTVAHMFRLDEDLSGFYDLVGADGELSWSAGGAGRTNAACADRLRGRREDDLHADTTSVRSPFTFLFTDIEGSTRLVKQLRERWGDVVGEHQQSPGRLPPTPRTSSLCLGGW